MGDRSGWMVKVAARPSTLTRRLSFRKSAPDRFFFVLDGASLTWYEDVGGRQLGNIHMKDVEYVEMQDSVGETTAFALRMLDKSSHNFTATSSKPDVSDAHACLAWVAALRKARELIQGSFGTASNTGMMF
jgi:hypothetical protein